MPLKTETFPPGKWYVSVRGRIATHVRGEHLEPKPYGLFVVWPAEGERALRRSFTQWKDVVQIYQIGD